MSAATVPSNSFLISQEQLTSGDLLPDGLTVTRASVSSNFLVCKEQEPPAMQGLLLTNFDPKTYNTWFPLFHFVPWVLATPAATYSELRSHMFDNCAPSAQPGAACQVALERIRHDLELQRFEATSEPWLPQEIWLKYSRSQKQWTVYRFDYYVARVFEPSGELQLRVPERVFFPLQGPEFVDALETGIYRGVPIVDNILRVLRLPDVVNQLRARSLPLGLRD
jgi:hypothetical protein